MDQTIVELSGVALGLVPVVVTLTAIIRQWVPDTRWAPVIAMALGVLGSWALIPATLVMAVFTGILIGLTACGAYSSGKAIIVG